MPLRMEFASNDDWDFELVARVGEGSAEAFHYKGKSAGKTVVRSIVARDFIGDQEARVWDATRDGSYKYVRELGTTVLSPDDDDIIVDYYKRGEEPLVIPVEHLDGRDGHLVISYEQSQ